MPIYVYKCEECGSSYEVTQSMSEEHVYTCPDCGGKCEQDYSAKAGVGAKFVGSGFHVNDYPSYGRTH